MSKEKFIEELKTKGIYRHITKVVDKDVILIDSKNGDLLDDFSSNENRCPIPLKTFKFKDVNEMIQILNTFEKSYVVYDDFNDKHGLGVTMLKLNTLKFYGWNK